MTRVLLFLSSYSVLFFILALRFEHAPLVIGCAALSAAGVGGALWVLWSERAKAPSPFEIATIEDQGPEVAGYLASYLLPFVTLAQPSDRDVISYLLFLTVAGVVYVASDMLQINPMLYLLRRRVFKVTTPRGWTAYLVTRERPLSGETILATTLGPAVLVRSGAEVE